MNIFQRMNLTASFLIVGALVSAFALALGGSQHSSGWRYLLTHPNVLLLAVFIFFFKMKTMFDDHEHFGEPHQEKGGFRHIGFLLAMISWAFWGLAAYLVFKPNKSAEMMIISLLVSTAWIVVHLLEILVDRQRRSKEALISVVRQKWVLVNILYILLFGVFLGWISPIVQPGGWAVLVALLVLLLLDYLTSSSYPTSIGG